MPEFRLKSLGVVLTVMALSFGCGLCSLLEFFCERNIVEESPGIVEFGIPRPLKVVHGLNHPIDFFIPNQGEKRSIDPGSIWIIRSIVICPPQFALGLADG